MHVGGKSNFRVPSVANKAILRWTRLSDYYVQCEWVRTSVYFSPLKNEQEIFKQGEEMLKQ